MFGGKNLASPNCTNKFFPYQTLANMFDYRKHLKKIWGKYNIWSNAELLNI